MEEKRACLCVTHDAMRWAEVCRESSFCQPVHTYHGKAPHARCARSLKARRATRDANSVSPSGREISPWPTRSIWSRAYCTQRRFFLSGQTIGRRAFALARAPPGTIFCSWVRRRSRRRCRRRRLGHRTVVGAGRVRFYMFPFLLGELVPWGWTGLCCPRCTRTYVDSSTLPSLYGRCSSARRGLSARNGRFSVTGNPS